MNADGIERAAQAIDPTFLDSPQFSYGPFNDECGREVLLKVETMNPIRSFKGRGADWFVQQFPSGSSALVCASAGNFGQGLAYAAARRGHRLEVFTAANTSPVKIESIRRLGATVTLAGDDFDAAKFAAREAAERSGRRFVEDGREPEITEGAGTIGVELSRSDPLDAVVVPVGNGALVNGIGTWFRAVSPSTRVVGICAERAPAMAYSWRDRTVVETESADTIAAGVGVRVPVPEAVEQLHDTVDEVHLASEEAIVGAMRALARTVGLLVEPAGALAIAGLEQVPEAERVAAIVTGANLTEDETSRWFGIRRNDDDLSQVSPA